VRASRAFLWRKKEPQFPFFIVLWISSIDQPKNIGDIGPLCLSFPFFYMLIVLVCLNLILVYCFVLFSLTLSSTIVMPSKAQLGM
jgi:hypothetical protein